MSAYVAGKAVAIYPGDVVTLSSAALAGLKTSAVTVEAKCRLAINNGSAQTATVQYSGVDAEASYQALYDEGTAITVAATKAGSFNASPGFYRVLFGGDPGATTTTISR